MEEQKCYVTSLCCTCMFTAVIVFKNKPTIEDMLKVLKERIKTSPIQEEPIIKNGEICIGNSKVYIQTSEDQKIVNNN